MRLSDLIESARRRLRPRYRVTGDMAIPVPHLYGRVDMTAAMEAGRIEREQDQIRWFYYRRRLMGECGLTEARAFKYYRRAYPTGLAKVFRDEVRGLVRDINKSWELLNG